MSRHGWRCFHCNDYFPRTVGGRREASAHFGPTPETLPTCIERTTLAAAEIVELSRAARVSRDEAWERMRRAEEAEEAAYFKAEGPREDALRQLKEIRLNNRDLTQQLDEVRKLAPDVWRQVWDKFVGGEPYPLTTKD